LAGGRIHRHSPSPSTTAARWLLSAPPLRCRVFLRSRDLLLPGCKIMEPSVAAAEGIAVGGVGDGGGRKPKGCGTLGMACEGNASKGAIGWRASFLGPFDEREGLLPTGVLRPLVGAGGGRPFLDEGRLPTDGASVEAAAACSAARRSRRRRLRSSRSSRAALEMLDDVV